MESQRKRNCWIITLFVQLYCFRVLLDVSSFCWSFLHTDLFSFLSQVMYPLQFTKLLGLVDVEAVVYAGGCSSQAGAVRYATSLCVRPFVDGETAEEMAMVGLLTQDIRVRERKKPGQAGARRKFTWKKR